MQYAVGHAWPWRLAGGGGYQQNAQSGGDESEREVRMIDFIADLRRESCVSTEFEREIVELRNRVPRKQNETFIGQRRQGDSLRGGESV